jgi:hypothetical protein
MIEFTLSRRGLLAGLLGIFFGTAAAHGPDPHANIATVLLQATPPADEIIRFDELRRGDRSIINALRYHPARLAPVEQDMIDSETLWLARAIYSESKIPEEQELIAWVIRNRVETRFRGRSSYHGVVLDPFQFSAFNAENPKRERYIYLHARSRTAGWQTALSIAHHVMHADSSLRPFPVRTRHFYSEISMVGREYPDWAEGMKPVTPERTYRPAPRRFRFFEGIS